MHFNDITSLFAISRGQDFGQQAYIQLSTLYEFEASQYLNVCVPENWLNNRWDHLHDGYQYLALQQPLGIMLSDESPPPPLEHGILRVLFTSGMLSSENDDDILVSEFANRTNRLLISHGNIAIDVVIEREITSRRLLDTLNEAHSNGEPFHLWHHVGNTEITAEGITFCLFDGKLNHSVLESLVAKFFEARETKFRLFVLHTPTLATTLLPALSKLPFPCLVGLSMNQASKTLLRGFYMRLLSYDISTVVFLARLDAFIESSKSNAWSSLEILFRTQPLSLVSNKWRRSLIPVLLDNEKKRFLFLRANPLDAQAGILQLDNELKYIKRVLAHRNEEIVIRDEGALEVEEFTTYLLETRPHLVHFSGHGSTRGSLLWENSEGGKILMQPERIAPLLAKFNVQCVILNACYSIAMARALKSSGIVVIGMDDAVTNTTALHFARALYQAIAHGENLLNSFELAKLEINLYGASDEANIPQISDEDAAKKIRFFQPEDFRSS